MTNMYFLLTVNIHYPAKRDENIQEKVSTEGRCLKEPPNSPMLI